MSISPDVAEGRVCAACGTRMWRVAPYCDVCWDERTSEGYRTYLLKEAAKAGIPQPMLEVLNAAELEKALARLDH